MINLIIGIVIGAIFSPLLLKLFSVGWKKLDKNIDHLKEE